MITKFKLFEGHEDVDPYGEEDWGDEKDFQIGDDIICIDDSGTYGITKGKIYKIISVDSYSNPVIYTNKDERGGYFKHRFKKVNKLTNEGHEDIDPYGEEEWDEPNYKKGDIIIAIKNRFYYDGHSQFSNGEEFKIKDITTVSSGSIYFILSYLDDIPAFIINEDTMKEYFTKKLNEGHEDIDPYGEEEWEDEEINVGDIVKCIAPAGDLIINKKYEVKSFFSFGGENFLSLIGIDQSYYSKRFKKIGINESHDRKHII